ncbi:uncharacterized protein VSU04_002112 [Chlamydotis macqueenii]
MTWAQINWHNPQAAILAKEQILKLGKGKALVCGVLGAALVTAQWDLQAVVDRISSLTKGRFKQGKGKVLVCGVLGAALVGLWYLTRQAEQDATKVKVLQEHLENETKGLSAQCSLAAEQATNQRLHSILTEALEWEKILKQQLNETRSQIGVGNMDVISDQGNELELLDPFEDLEHIPSPGTEAAKVRPLIKTEAVDDGHGGAQQLSIHTIPYSPPDLDGIQEEYSWGPREMENEYVGRVSLTGGDHILLPEIPAGVLGLDLLGRCFGLQSICELIPLNHSGETGRRPSVGLRDPWDRGPSEGALESLLCGGSTGPWIIVGTDKSLEDVAVVLKQKGSHWLSPSRFLKYQAVLVEQDNVKILNTNLINPAAFLSSEQENSELLQNDCLEVVESTYSSRPDLKEEPLLDAETWYTDGSGFIKNGEHKSGHAITTLDSVIESNLLPPGTSAQKAEIIAFIRALQKAKGKQINIWTDLKYAFGVVHAHGAMWKERGLLTFQGKQIKDSKEILELLDAVQLPQEVAIMHCKGHQKGETDQQRGNRLADQEAKWVAEQSQGTVTIQAIIPEESPP